MFDKSGKRFFIVIDGESRMLDSSHQNIKSARERAEKLANEKNVLSILFVRWIAHLLVTG